MFIFAPKSQKKEIIMGRKAEERERKRERNKKMIEFLSCAFGLLLIADVFVFIVASLTCDVVS